MDDVDLSDEPNLNTGTPWSAWDDEDIRWLQDHKVSIEEIANFLCWTPTGIRRRIKEIAGADAIGDPSLLRAALRLSAPPPREKLVRNGLAAGGRRIRTAGPPS